jgi:L-aminopeptidase/D-esterase-like protein
VTDVDGVAVGHWTDATALTGCTVVLLPEGTTASGEVRGGAPAGRETDLLDPTRLVRSVDAVVLAGGSAFGLAAADGVMAYLEARGRGFPTAAGPVPIVVAFGLYDLAVGDARVRPGAEQGRLACEAAHSGVVELGAVGAGTGCTIDKVLGAARRRPGGLVGAATVVEGATVAALVAVNAFGRVIPPGSAATVEADWAAFGRDHPFTNTTVGVVVTDAALDKVECHLAAQSAHDGLARAVVPAHTRFDGDAFVVAATGMVPATAERVRAAAAHVVATAVGTLAPGERPSVADRGALAPDQRPSVADHAQPDDR